MRSNWFQLAGHVRVFWRRLREADAGLLELCIGLLPTVGLFLTILCRPLILSEALFLGVLTELGPCPDWPGTWRAFSWASSSLSLWISCSSFWFLSFCASRSALDEDNASQASSNVSGILSFLWFSRRKSRSSCVSWRCPSWITKSWDAICSCVRVPTSRVGYGGGGVGATALSVGLDWLLGIAGSLQTFICGGEATSK